MRSNILSRFLLWKKKKVEPEKRLIDQEIISLYYADRAFKQLGATHYYDEHYPPALRWSTRPLAGQLSSRHYFKNGVEIGYVLPDFFPVGRGVQVFTQYRTWWKMPPLNILSVEDE